MEMSKLWNVESFYNCNAKILRNIVFVTVRNTHVCIYTVWIPHIWPNRHAWKEEFM